MVSNEYSICNFTELKFVINDLVSTVEIKIVKLRFHSNTPNWTLTVGFWCLWCLNSFYLARLKNWKFLSFNWIRLDQILTDICWDLLLTVANQVNFINFVFSIFLYTIKLNLLQNIILLKTHGGQDVNFNSIF